jgi:predicted oxidoreductase (fatty acid repression mutant protein)
MADAAHDEPVASKRASSSRALARARSGTSLKHWSPYWRTAITNAAAVGRPTLLYSIAELPLGPSEDQPADETSQIAFHIAQALLDTRRWWPSGP